ncbi:hypothetical protein [Vibrio mediterranei]|uniref:hypothetical protein n=1 Tax=Vibrio mediterranei TaxID=689 RepID=UPI0040698E44
MKGRKHARDRYVSASELAQVSFCPYMYYLNVNRKSLTEGEKYGLARGNVMHENMNARVNSKRFIKTPNVRYRQSEKTSLFGRFIRFLMRCIGVGR